MPTRDPAEQPATADDTPAAQTPQESGSDPSSDALHEQFRAALERKKTAQHHPGDDPGGTRGIGPSSNTKRQRQFRRKSGG